MGIRLRAKVAGAESTPTHVPTVCTFDRKAHVNVEMSVCTIGHHQALRCGNQLLGHGGISTASRCRKAVDEMLRRANSLRLPHQQGVMVRGAPPAGRITRKHALEGCRRCKCAMLAMSPSPCE